MAAYSLLCLVVLYFMQEQTLLEQGKSFSRRIAIMFIITVLTTKHIITNVVLSHWLVRNTFIIKIYFLRKAFCI